MSENQNERNYTMRRVKLSEMYERIGKFLKEHGDADIISVASCTGYDDKTKYKLELADLNSFNTRLIGEIAVKYEDVPYTNEEWFNGVITVSKIDTSWRGKGVL